MINLGVVGYGYWGPNIVRNFYSLKDVRLLCICDQNKTALERARNDYPDVKLTCHYQDIVNSPLIDIIAIITPLSSHFEIAKKSLQNKKHVFIEKPFTCTSSEAEILIDLAEKHNLKIMIDHTFIFSESVRKIKGFVENDIMGILHYYDSTRANFGPFRYDANVIWDLATHDFSIIDYLFKDKPLAISVHGRSYGDNGVEDTAYIIVYFSDNRIAHINVNWVSPIKIRNVIIRGDKRMLVWDDLNKSKKISLYKDNVIVGHDADESAIRREWDFKNKMLPPVNNVEALRNEVEYVVNCILNDQSPINDGHSGLRMVRLLEAANESLKHSGKLTYL